MSAPPSYNAAIAAKKVVTAAPAFVHAAAAGNNNNSNPSPPASTVTFTVNDETYTVQSSDIASNYPLVRFIRERTPYRGVKEGCGEGGCGACTVAYTQVDQTSGKTETRAIHSCLRPVMSCAGATITTNDGLTRSNNEVAGKIQTTLAEYNGSQCGFCSSGMVTTMYALLCRTKAEGRTPSALEIEREFDGNLCRCTGYRPIMDAMKTFASKSVATPSEDDFRNQLFGGGATPECVKDNCCKKRGLKIEIEEAATTLLKEQEEEASNDIVVHRHKDRTKTSLKLVRPQLNPASSSSSSPVAAVGCNVAIISKIKSNNDGVSWVDCSTIDDINYYLPWYASLGKPVILAVAQTSQAVLPQTAPVKLYIGKVPELNTITSSPTSGILIGAAVPIAKVIEYLQTVTPPSGGFAWQTKHFPQAALHLNRIASQLLRNIACLTGNLFLAKHSYARGKDFQSDATTVLFGLGATLHCYDTIAKSTLHITNVDDFFSTDFTGKYVRTINIPWAKSSNEWFRSYKIAVRRDNAHAYVNAAMKVTLDSISGKVSAATIVFGGVFGRDAQVKTLEQAFQSAPTITSNAGAQAVLAQADKILVPVNAPNDAPMTAEMTAYVHRVAVGYVYKLLLSLQPALDAQLASASQCWLTRTGPSSSTQTYNGSDPSEAPVNAPITKMHALNQTDGTAVYTADLPKQGQDALFAALVLCDVAVAPIVSIDASAASQVAGFVQFIDATFFAANPAANAWAQGEIFASKTSAYAGQPVGVCLATSEFAAQQAAAAVKVVMGSPPAGGPVLTIKDSIKAGRIIPHQAGMPPFIVSQGNATQVIASTPAANKYTGEVEMGWQYHFHLEGQEATVVPREGRFDVFSSTQMPVAIQACVAGVFGVPASKVHVEGRRCGGGYGGKITSSQLPAVIAATACLANGSKRAVSLSVHMPEYFRALGARSSRLMQYTVCWSETGLITALDANIYCGVGVSPSDEIGGAFVTVQSLDNCYNIPNFSARAHLAGTDTPAVAACRGPGWVPAIMLMEAVISQVAAQTKIARDQVRLRNFYKKGDVTPGGMVLSYFTINELWSQLTASANFAQRQADIAAWNQSNYFVKKGLAMTPVRFSVGQTGANFNALVAVFPDGTINITTGGSEIGQGLHIKVAQVAAYRLGMNAAEMEAMVEVLPTSTRVLTANSNVTGGSVTSELCCLAVMHACDEINRRVAPFRNPQNPTWAAVAVAAANAGVDLTVTGFTYAPPSAAPFNYCSYGAACVETLVDTLTGEYLISRADLLFDAGRSLNPMIDVGQIEGGFMFGCGYEAFEEVSYNPATGMPLNATTWKYKPPSAYDLPQQWNTTLLANAPNPLGVLGSKATGEPGVCLGSALVQSLEMAVEAQLQQSQGAGVRFAAQRTPFTVTRVQDGAQIKVADMVVQLPK